MKLSISAPTYDVKTAKTVRYFVLSDSGDTLKAKFAARRIDHLKNKFLRSFRRADLTKREGGVTHRVWIIPVTNALAISVMKEAYRALSFPHHASVNGRALAKQRHNVKMEAWLVTKPEFFSNVKKLCYKKRAKQQ